MIDDIMSINLEGGANAFWPAFDMQSPVIQLQLGVIIPFILLGTNCY